MQEALNASGEDQEDVVFITLIFMNEKSMHILD